MNSKKEIIVISNTCVGAEIYHNFKMEYTSPFIGTLIPNDEEYLKLCRNVLYYINIEPVFNMEPKNGTVFDQQNDGKYYKHKSIKTPYPVIHLEDIEIHCIHDTFENAKAKWLRRVQRAKEIIERDNFMIFNCLVITELLNSHENTSDFIKEFTEINDDNIIENIFIGPEQYCSNKNYIIDNRYDVNLNKRDSSHVIVGNDQTLSGNILTDVIKSKI